MSRYGAEYIQRLDEDADFFLIELWRELGKDAVHPLEDLFFDAWRFANGIPTEPGEAINRTRGIGMWRAAGKTTALVAPLICRRLRRDPIRKTIILSKTDGAAKQIAAMTKFWIQKVWFLQDLQPEDDQKDSEKAFNVSGHDGDKQPSVRAMGIETQLESNRAHTVIGDDIETKMNTRTKESRANLEALTGEMSNMLYTPLPGEKLTQRDPLEVLLFGTNKHEDTLSKRLIKPPKCWTFRTYPIAGPEPKRQIVGLAPIIKRRMDPKQLRPGEKLIKPGDPTCPERIDHLELAQRKKVGTLEFEREYMLYTDIADVRKYPIRLENFIVFDVDAEIAPARILWGKERGGTSTQIPDSKIVSLGFGDDAWYGPMHVDEGTFAPYTDKLLTVDPASKGGDRVGYAAGGALNDRSFVMEVDGLDGGGSDENLTHIVLRARFFNIRRMSVEGNNGGEFFAKLLRARISELSIEPGKDRRRPDGWTCSVDIHWATQRKEVRLINTFDALLTPHTVVVHPRVAKHEELQRQLTRLCDEPDCLGHEDEADALEALLAQLSGNLDRSSAKAAEERAAEVYWEGLQREMAGIHGYEPPADSFLTWRQRLRGQ